MEGYDELPVQSCVAVQGNGSGIAPRPFHYNDDDAARGTDSDGKEYGYSQFVVMGNGAHIEGLHLRGPAAGRREGLPTFIGIYVPLYPERSSSDIRIADNELEQWPLAAVAIGGRVSVPRGTNEVPAGTPLLTSTYAAGIRVERNYIHENAHDGRGYGVVIGSGGYATIDANVFDYNRHAISSDGSPHSGYVATRNYVLQGGYTQGTWPGYYNQHFDIHGWADGGYGGIGGEYHDISYNTFRGDQGYYVTKTRAALMVRGTPTMGAWFHHNTAVHDDCAKAITLDDGDFDPTGGPEQIFNVYCTDNNLDVDASTELGVGDFDGDGFDDLFVATGSAWYASYAGITEWRLLRTSTLRLSQIKIGRFDGDARSDVFAVEGTTWRYYPSGSGEPITLRTDSASPAGFLYGDVDGNGMTDVLQVIGSSIQWSKDARAAFVQRALRPSSTLASNLRVANLNGDAFDDLFIANSNLWQWLSRGQGTWQALNEPLTTSSSSLVLVDVTGDRRADVLRRSGNNWEMSLSGTGEWQIVRGGSSAYNEPRKAVFGNFDGVVGNEAIRWEQLLFCDPFTGVCSYYDGTRPARWVNGWGDAFQTYGAPALR
jgi:hypothetical protein